MKNWWMVVAAGMFVAGAIFGTSYKPDLMDQRNFPCQEDEALMFHPSDHNFLVCVNLEELR